MIILYLNKRTLAYVRTLKIYGQPIWRPPYRDYPSQVVITATIGGLPYKIYRDIRDGKIYPDCQVSRTIKQMIWRNIGRWSLKL